METNQDGHIVIVLSNKGYVAVENNQMFQLWKNKCLKDIYQELKTRYPKFKISLGSLEKIHFNKVVEVCNKYLNKTPETELITETTEVSSQKSNTNSNKDLETGNNKMKANQKVKIKAATVIGINITAGVFHLGFQSMADLICYGEAKLIDQLNVFDKTVEEIMKARKDKTLETQQYLLKTPEKAKQKASQFYCRIKEIKDNAKSEYNQFQTS
ncbi:hypothetical protein [Seonamhaeicola aphaedonensis]|uniref:Uncharacterized protein n=1 Tax=Seonamhaeicola aphaedonensis TaxID=1461338 RepID=A0A3D9HH74_9FLAO|nr:hypothetical protein [Seonamhaeicola aphaedonensis]RED48820.1 hypothetical protein DFQ02_103150 [Seonamhaeicola aphaedonensis]